ncbi:MAG: acyl-CoA transferase [Azospirillum brasilense]|nr:MAG: acyl-CoA transferase [Azospirillum brasilense]
MSSSKETLLQALHDRLQTLASSDTLVTRNPGKAQKIPDGGALVTLRDGDSGEPEVLLSPLTYIYEHEASIEVSISTLSPETLLDTVLQSIGTVLEADRTLGGLAEWMEPRAADVLQDDLEGAPAIRLATIPVMIRFHTENPLH